MFSVGWCCSDRFEVFRNSRLASKEERLLIPGCLDPVKPSSFVGGTASKKSFERLLAVMIVVLEHEFGFPVESCNGGINLVLM